MMQLSSLRPQAWPDLTADPEAHRDSPNQITALRIGAKSCNRVHYSGFSRTQKWRRITRSDQHAQIVLIYLRRLALRS